MTRDNLIQRLVDRKVNSAEKSRAFCICLARAFCIPSPRETPPGLKK